MTVTDLPNLKAAALAAKLAAQAAVTGQPRLATAAVLADHFGVDIRTVYRWVKQRRIPAIRRGERCLRFNLGEVVEALKVEAENDA